MSNNGLLEVQKKISEIENAIRERDINRGISAYNTLRIYSSDPSIDFQTKKLAHERGIELHKTLVQLRQEILQNDALQATNTRTIEAKPEYADPMPLKNFSKPNLLNINFKIVIMILIILGLLAGGTYLLMNSNNSQGCSIDGPFACKETSLKVSANSMAQNYIILKMDQSKGIITQINITNISQSLRNCNNVYIDKKYSLATNYQELKIIFDCKNISLTNITGDITIGYKLDGSEQTSKLRISTLQSAINTEIKSLETPKVDTTNNTMHINNTNTTSKNNINNTANITNSSNDYNYPGYEGDSGGGGGGGSSVSSSCPIGVDCTLPKINFISIDYTPTINSDGTTFNITVTAQGQANGYKVLSSLAITIVNGITNTISCSNNTQIITCVYIYACPKNSMGSSITYYAVATGLDGLESDEVHHSYIVPDFILPSVDISTSNSNNLISTPATITGTASDNYLLSYVEYRVNNGTWHNTTGTYSWSISANVHNGTNYIEVRATDAYSIPNTNSTIKIFNTTLRPEFNMTIYYDGLDENWLDTSYNSTINLSDYSTVYSGNSSISFSGSYTGALSLTKTNNTMINNIDGYNNLSFDINGTSGTDIIVRARGDADDSMFPSINLSNITGTSLTGSWEHVEITMTTLNPYRYPINTIDFTPIVSNNTNDTIFYIDSLEWTGKISDITAPQIIIEYPANNSVINMPLATGNRIIPIKGNVTDDTYIDKVLANLNGTPINMSITNYFTLIPNITHNWSGNITLNDGINLINITAYDTYGRISGIYLWNITLNWTPDMTAPYIAITSTTTNNRTNQTIITINGNSTDDINGTGLNYTLWNINLGPWHNISNNSIWNQTILLINDTNFIEAESFDNSGNNATKNVTIYYNYTNIGAIPLIIYNDNNLTTNWTNNNSTNQTITVNSIEQVYCGNTTLKTDSLSSGTLNMMIGSASDAEINSMNYTRVRFAIYANQSMNLNVKLGSVNGTNVLYYGSSTLAIPAATWYIADISVNALMNGNTFFNSLGLTNTESNSVTYYMDNIQIVP